MEFTLTSSQDQSGITTKLWRNHPEQTTEQQQERGLITSDRQQNQLQHNLIDRESGRDVRGLPGQPKVAAEALEGYLSGWLDPPEECGV